MLGILWTGTNGLVIRNRKHGSYVLADGGELFT
jgi:hypothetical protein